MEEFLTELLSPIAKNASTATVRESAAGSEDAGAAAVREAHASVRARHRRLNDVQAEYIVDRAVAVFVDDPYSDESFEAVVTREADSFVETLPAPLGQAGAIRAFDSLIASRNGR